jgi:ABC-type nitrate/sulfonate/bicarbonate transport system permease component
MFCSIMSRRLIDLLNTLPAWLVPLSLLVAVEIAMRGSGIESDGLALPSQVAIALAGLIADGEIFLRTAETIGAIAVGVPVGGTVGLLLGVWLGLSPKAAQLASLSIELFRPIPPVAIIPLTLLIYGLGIRMEAAIVAFACFWPMLLLTRDAVRSVEPRLIEVARMLGLSRARQIATIAIPAALPRIFTALRLTLGIALIVAVTTEITANPIGLGYAIISAGLSLRPEAMYAFLVWLAVLGWLLNAGLIALHRRLFGAAHGEVAA